MDIGRGAAAVLTSSTGHKPRILIGKDTRQSGDMLEAALTAGLCSVGADVESLGVVPTPAVAYLVRKYNADAGVVISASHNPMEFNGIKIFAGTGYKLPDDVENEIEAYIDNKCAGLKLATGDDVGRVTYRTDGIKDYTDYLYESINGDLSGLNVCIDCANGASAAVARQLFPRLGANGCGKSTLAKHFNAILLPEEGKVYVEGMDTADDDKLYDIRQTVGMVFQSPDNQIVATVVEEDVAFALENLGVPPEEMRRRVDDAMKMAGIYEFRERAPHNLSGGQKQRVAIAGVVAMRPDCLILDEATAMLDPRGREQVMQTIHHLNKDLGITVVSITHYMEEAAQADRVLVMSQGSVVMEGTPKEVFSQTEKVRSLRLDVPQAAELRDELVKAGIPMPEGIIDTGECAQALYELLK